MKRFVPCLLALLWLSAYYMAYAQETRLYLPFVTYEDPLPDNPAIVNGSFEEGSEVGWSTKGQEVFIHHEDNLPVSAYHGEWLANLWSNFGFVDGNLTIIEGQISQSQIVIPKKRPYLHYVRWLASGPSCAQGSGMSPPYLRVSVNQTTVDSIDVCTDTMTNGWENQVIDLTSFVGQEIELSFKISFGGSGGGTAFIDRVVFKADPS